MQGGLKSTGVSPRSDNASQHVPWKASEKQQYNSKGKAVKEGHCIHGALSIVLIYTSQRMVPDLTVIHSITQA